MAQLALNAVAPRFLVSAPGGRSYAASAFGLLEWLYAAVVVQTLLVNPIIAESGSLQLYLNTVTWPLLGVGAIIRWCRGRDRQLNKVFPALLLGTTVLVWLVLFEAGFIEAAPYAGGNLLRLLYLPVGILAAVAVHRNSERLLDVALCTAALKGLAVLAPLFPGPFDLANRLTVIELGGHNSFGAFLVFLVLLRASVWAIGGRRPSAIVLASLGVSVVCVLLTFSRTAFAALVIGLAVLGLLSLRRRGGSRRSVGAGLVLIVALAPLLVAGPLQERLTTRSGTGTSGRTELWQEAWDGFTRHPLFGNGFGSYEAFSESVVDLAQPLVVGGTTYSAHSAPLQILYEWGVAGLTLAALASWLLLRRCWSLVLLPVAVAAVVVALFETFHYVVQVSWVAGLVLAVGLNGRHRSSDRGSRRRHSWHNEVHATRRRRLADPLDELLGEALLREPDGVIPARTR